MNTCTKFFKVLKVPLRALGLLYMPWGPYKGVEAPTVAFFSVWVRSRSQQRDNSPLLRRNTAVHRVIIKMANSLPWNCTLHGLQFVCFRTPWGLQQTSKFFWWRSAVRKSRRWILNVLVPFQGPGSWGLRTPSRRDLWSSYHPSKASLQMFLQDSLGIPSGFPGDSLECLQDSLGFP